MISIKIEGIFEPEQVRIQKSIDKEDFGRKGLFSADSIFNNAKNSALIKCANIYFFGILFQNYTW
ncbi:MAG: hypothetical protein JJU02_02235 [Cryomorphaceae bacterium]|nr:hypothetical protein [Cryomorphaceae bacterium]